MLKLDPCPKSGRVYLKLNREEVFGIADIVYAVMKANPRQPGKEHAPIVALSFQRYISELLGDDDYTESDLKTVLWDAKKHEIAVPPALSSPGRTFEKFRGVYTNDEYHWLRKYKYARWLIECAIKHGIDLAFELENFSVRLFVGTAPTIFDRPTEGTLADAMALSSRIAPLIPWYQIAKEPQIPEMAAALQKNREAEKKKRKNTRVDHKTKKLREAGWIAKGYAGWVLPRVTYDDKDEVS